jgi:hypothetical protein
MAQKTINVQVVNPPENIIAMYATGDENGWFA